MPQGHNQRTCHNSPQPPIYAERQAGKLQIPFFKIFWYDSTRGMNPKSTDCEADALATTPSRRLSLRYILFDVYLTIFDLVA